MKRISTCPASTAVRPARRMAIGLTTALMLAFAGAATADTTAPALAITQFHGMPANAGDTPLVRVWTDGRVLVHRPAWMRNSGRFTMQLPADEADGLLGAAEALAGWDARAVAAARDAASRAAGQALTLSSDPTVTRIAIDSETIDYRDLGLDARRYRDIAELQALSALSNALQALAKDDRLTRLGGEK